MDNQFKTFTVVKGPVVCRLMFTDKVRRVDIRAMDQGKFTKQGVSLTPSQLQFCSGYADGYNDDSGEAAFFSLQISRESKNSFRIKKDEKPDVITSCAFWKTLKPLIPAMIHIIASDPLPIDQLLDLHFLSTKLTVQELKRRKWVHIKAVDYKQKNCFLNELGVIVPEMYKDHQIDFESLNRFLKEEPILFDSLCKFMYI